MAHTFVLVAPNLALAEWQPTSEQLKAYRELFTSSRTYQISFPDSFDPTSKSVSFREISEEFDRLKPSSIEEGLHMIKKMDPEFLKRPGLGFETRAPQEGSPSEPRAISVTKNGKLAMAFAGIHQRKGNVLEFLEYDEVTNQNTLYEIGFSEKTYNVTKNPDECLTCHTGPSRDLKSIHAIWDSYNHWPRFAGGEPVNEEVLKSYSNFFQSYATHSRYSVLEDVIPPSEVSSSDRVFSESYNNRINNALQYWNLLRLAKDIKNSSKYPEYEAAILKTLQYGQTEDVVARLPEKDRRDFLAWLNSQTADDSSSVMHNRLLRLFAYLGIDLRDFIMVNDRADKENTFGFGDESYGLDPALYPLLRKENQNADSNDDAQFPKIDLHSREFQNLPNPWQPTPYGPERILKMDCASCHSEKNTFGYPQIPFEDSSKLAKLITPRFIMKITNRIQESDPKRRMPLHFPALSQEDRNSVIAYLRSLH